MTSSSISPAKIGFVIKFVTIFSSLALTFSANGQYFKAGQDPSFIKWREINTKNFQVIYPSDDEETAQKVARVFEKVYDYSGFTLQHQPGKISILLHSKSIKSNGFVAWSPARIELFPTPGQDMYSQDWIEQLALHELRHHVQIDKIDSELPGIFKILLGEQAASIVIGAYLPFWFLEGDAVATETALSQTGRGRVPSFSMELKAQVDSKRKFSLDKAYLGSYKDHIPDHYQLGYQIVSNIRAENGGGVWGDVLQRIANKPLSINPLARGLKLATGMNQDQYYHRIMQNLKSNESNTQHANSDSIHPIKVLRSKYYTDYLYPHFLNDTTIVALRIPLNEIPYFTLISSDKREKKLFTPGEIALESVSFSDDKLIWVEVQTDRRWTHLEKSLLRILNVKTGELREKVYSEKIFAPAFSHDGRHIAVVKMSDQNQSSIELVSTSSLLFERTVIKSSYSTFFTPSWSEDDDALYAVQLNNHGRSLIEIRLMDNYLSLLTASTYSILKRPLQQGNLLLFGSDREGIDMGYALSLTEKKTYRVVSSKYGLRDIQASSSGKKLLVSQYTADGFKLGKRDLHLNNQALVPDSSVFRYALADKLSSQEKGIVDFSNLDTTKLDSKKYSKFSNLINIHSWSPVYVDPDQTQINYGFSIASQNKLTTAITQFGYNYSTVDQSGKLVGKFEYSGFYPIFQLYADYGNERSNYYQINKYYSSKGSLIRQDTVSVSYKQHVFNARIDLKIPFNFSHGKMYRLIQPEIQFGYTYRWNVNQLPGQIFHGSYNPFTYRLYAHNIIHQSSNDLQPRWGQILDLQYRHTPFGDKKLGSILAGEFTLFLPGIATNHGMSFYAATQKKVAEMSSFNDLIYYPRGYSAFENTSMLCVKSDYVLPLLYPDFHLWHLYYLKRISLRLHYDFAQLTIPVHNTNQTMNKNISSAGAEISSDCHLLRFIAPMKIGLRESYLPESRQFISEFLVSINFKQF